MLIKAYRYAISGLLGHCCRFEPSCSTYAMEAIKTHGSLKGGWLAMKRVLRCHPWHQGGIDPVPAVAEKKSEKELSRSSAGTPDRVPYTLN